MMTMREFIDGDGVTWIYYEDGNGYTRAVLKTDESQESTPAL